MPADPEFLNAVPVLMTSDVSRAADYYTQHLGFAISSMYPEYLIVRRGDVWLHFTQVLDLDPKVNPCSTYIYVRGVAELYEQCKTEGILRHHAWLRERDYGMRDFSVVDPDGNLLTFGESIAPDARG